MAPPLKKEEESLLYDLYYNKKFNFGRDKIFKYLQSQGSDISRRQVSDWLGKQEVNQLYAPSEKHKVIQSTILSRPLQQIGIDLIDMQNNEYKGYRYILTAIDLYSKKAWAIPLKNKEDTTVAEAFVDIAESIAEAITTVRSDNGSEFISNEFKKVLNDLGIKQVLGLPGKPESNGNIERFNGILKRSIGKVLTVENSKDWVSIIPQLIKNYNDSYQRTIKTTPTEASTVPSDKIKENIKKAVLSKRDKQEPKFELEDRVRLKLDDIGKGRPNFTKTIFMIYKRHKPKNNIASPYYFVSSLDGKKKYTEKLYDNDLVLANTVENETKADEKFEISKLIKPMIKKGVNGYLVRWKYYTEADDTFESRDKLLEDVPKMVHEFEKKHKVIFESNKIKWAPNSK